VEVWLLAFLTSAQGGGEWSSSLTGHFTPGEEAPHIHWCGGEEKKNSIFGRA